MQMKTWSNNFPNRFFSLYLQVIMKWQQTYHAADFFFILIIL